MIALSSDGSVLAVADCDRVRIWNVGSASLMCEVVSNAHMVYGEGKEAGKKGHRPKLELIALSADASTLLLVVDTQNGDM